MNTTKQTMKVCHDMSKKDPTDILASLREAEKRTLHEPEKEISDSELDFEF